jgi:hypothetical protein
MRVFICSPFAGDLERNLGVARRLCTLALSQGHAPIAPHLLYPQVLDDSDPSSRAVGLRAGFEFLRVCGEVWAFRSYGLSNGMLQELSLAIGQGIPIRYFGFLAGSEDLFEMRGQD